MMSRPAKIAIDALCAAIALFLAFAIVFSIYTADWLGYAVRLTRHSIAPYVLLAVGASIFTKLDRKSWRFVSLADVFAIVKANVISAAALLAWSFLFDRASNLPRSSLFVIMLLNIGLMVSARLALRIYRDPSTMASMLSTRNGVGNTIVVGSAAAIDGFLRDPRHLLDDELVIAGAIVCGERWRSGEIRGVDVLGQPDELLAIIDRFRASGRRVENMVVLEEELLHDGTIATDALVKARDRDIRLLRLPRISELAPSGPSARTALRDVSFEELLQRPSVNLDISPVTELLRGKRVLVTGAGGSIGSELSRQVTALGCAHLSCVDHSEFNLYTIDEELGRSGSSVPHSAHLCDVRDSAGIAALFESQRPDIVFHAAALKHVPLMDENPIAAVSTNIIGTRNVRLAAEAANCSTLVLVSTDKSVAPSSIMGATKRVAESVARTPGARPRSRAMRTVVVRFGNVLGSAGSVIPLFRAQLQRGGPITITHPDVERFFMTIPEAVLLIFHAASLGQTDLSDGGEIYVLEMGEPIKIVDLARQVAAAYDVELGRDVAIEFVGLRPGEKITEELVDEGELVAPSTRRGIRCVRSPSLPPAELDRSIDALQSLAQSHDEAAVRAALGELLVKIRFPAIAPHERERPAFTQTVGR